MKKCICDIQYEDGTADIIIAELTHGGSFSLAEMERWQAEQSEKPVKNIRCTKIPSDLLKALEKFARLIW